MMGIGGALFGKAANGVMKQTLPPKLPTRLSGQNAFGIQKGRFIPSVFYYLKISVMRFEVPRSNIPQPSLSFVQRRKIVRRAR